MQDALFGGTCEVGHLPPALTAFGGVTGGHGEWSRPKEKRSIRAWLGAEQAVVARTAERGGSLRQATIDAGSSAPGSDERRSTQAPLRRQSGDSSLHSRSRPLRSAGATRRSDEGSGSECSGGT